MQSPQTFTISINNNKLKLSKQLCKMSTFLNNMVFLGNNSSFDFGMGEEQNQEEEIYIQLIDEQTFMSFVEFCEINSFSQLSLMLPVKSNNLQDVCDKKNCDFIAKFDYGSPQLIKLLQAAQFLGCKPLEKLIALKYACLIYFQDSKQCYEKKCKELQIQSKISFEDDEKFKKLYSFSTM